MDLENKTVLITGGARMGKAIGLALAEKGANIALTYSQSETGIAEAVEMIESIGVRAKAYPVDLTDSTQYENLIQAVNSELGTIAVLLNMASIYYPIKFEDLKREEWESFCKVHIEASLFLSQAAAKEMHSEGRIINFTDWNVESGRPANYNQVAYYVSKKAIMGITESLALNLAPRILVNSIAPGPILPVAGMSLEQEKQILDATPLGVWGGVEEIVKAVLFLIESNYITGECIRVDGGRHLK